jgi:KTSC domain-containing protein
MERIPVTQGRNISEVGYDAASQTLEIKFSSGGIYSYAAVPPEVHDKLIHDKSPGGYFATFIRPCYEFVHLNPKPKKEEADGESQKS